MKKFLFLALIGFGLVSLSACSLSNRVNTKDKQPPAPSAAADEAAGQATTSSILTDGSYQVAPETSRLAWQASKVVATHTGLVAIKSGSIQVAGGVLTGASLIIDMPSLTSDENIGSLVKHLNGPDFFDTAVYPEAILVVKSVKAGARSGEYLLSGDLTIKNVTAPIDFTAQVFSVNGRLDIKSELAIDRTKWNIKYGSGRFFKDLGDQMISDEIKLNVAIQATR